jgi:predicted ABC-type ATPase
VRAWPQMKASARDHERSPAHANSKINIFAVSTPRFTVVVGADGCGKTTLASDPDFFRKIPILDPNAIARTLQLVLPPSAFPIASARQVLQSATRHISRGKSFAVETTLSGKSYLQMMTEEATD